MIIRQSIASTVTVDAFEVCVLNEKAIASKGRLQRPFPGSSVRLSRTLFEDENFSHALAQPVETLSFEVSEEFAEHTKKAGSVSVEVRQPPKPDLITSQTMAMLEAYGERVSDHTIWKRMRDEVNWEDAYLPWRQSPRLQTLQVGLQLALVQRFGLKPGTQEYKSFVAFLLAKLCDLAVSSEQDNDYLEFIQAKLGRRIYKLSARLSAPHLDRFFREKLHEVRHELERRWRATINENKTALPEIPSIATDEDIRLSLTNSNGYLQTALTEEGNERVSTKPVFSEIRRYTQAANGIPIFEPPQKWGFDLILVLADLEMWVKLGMPQWANTNACSASESLCTDLADLIESYNTHAQRAYQNNPLQLSIAFLTVLEMWVVLDRFVTSWSPLMSRFTPEVPSTVLVSAQFMTLQDMERLNKVELYIQTRLEGCGNDSMFSDPKPGCFEVLFFDQSMEMRDLRHKIGQKAEEDKSAKLQEWQRTRARFDSLLARVRSKQCDQVPNRRWRPRHPTRPEFVHGPSCQKCECIREADSINITVFEEPLPESEAQAKAAVFDLLSPDPITSWRTATWTIVHDLGRPSKDHKRPSGKMHQTIELYPALSSFAQKTGKRLLLRSSTKSFHQAHYATSSGHFPSFQSLCKSNGLQLHLFDSQQQHWTTQQTSGIDFGHLLADDVPKSSIYKSLQHCLNGTAHTSNEIIAMQVQCPKELDIHAFAAFGELRAGEAVQWYNILRELASTDLDLGAEETSSLLVKTALQAGSRCDNEVAADEAVFRRAHVALHEPRLCLNLLHQLQDRHDSIQANWREMNCMKVVIVLTLRVAHMCEASTRLMSKASSLLAACRYTTLGWAHQLVSSCHGSHQALHRLRPLLLIAALLCRSTFVPIPNLTDSLEPSTFACFFESGIFVQDWSMLGQTDLPQATKDAIIEDWKLSHLLEPTLRHTIGVRNSVLTEGVERDCPSDWQFGDWSALYSPNERWYTTTCSCGPRSHEDVHFNILDGQLLVGMEKLGRLPASYTEQSLYSTLFLDQIFDVFPSNESGMTHTTKTPVEGHNLYFGMRDGLLVIRARSSGQTLELIPSQVFEKGFSTPDLPSALIDDCCHWLCLESQTLHIRPWSTRWRSTSQDWLVVLNSRHCTRLGQSLVDPRSKVADRIAQSLGHFETARHHLITKSEASHITVLLPRYGLNFGVCSDGKLESTELRSILVDDSCLETFVGLTTKLVLRQIADNHTLVVVPLGLVSYTRREHHVEVSVDANSESNVEYLPFVLNDVLRFVDCAPDPAVVYYKAYLHALTSNPLPDPFTGWTGVEESLRCLKEPSSQPWTPLDQESKDILMKIEDLAPKRQYYPKHLRVMQTIAWDGHLPASTQHDDFQIVANQILDVSRQLRPFFAGENLRDDGHINSHGHLSARARSYNALFRNPDSLAVPVSTPIDSVYKGRDGRKLNCQELATFEVTALICQWSREVLQPTNVMELFNSWREIKYSDAFGPATTDDLLSMSFKQEWGYLFRLCQRSTKLENRHELAFLLSMIAYGKEVDMKASRALLAVAFTDVVSIPTPPPYSNYTHFVAGERPDRSSIIAILKRRSLDYSDDGTEDWSQHATAKALHDTKVQDSANEFASLLTSQWPCESPRIDLHSFDDTLFADLSNALVSIRTEWVRLWKNHRLRLHIKDVQPFLDACEARGVACLAATDRFRMPHIDARSSTKFPTFEVMLKGSKGYAAIKNEYYRQTLQSRAVLGSSAAKAAKVVDGVNLEKLEALCLDLRVNTNDVRRQYGVDLSDSLAALRSKSVPTVHTERLDLQELRSKEQEAAESMNESLDRIRLSLESHGQLLWLELADLRPRATPISLLKCLSTNNGLALPNPLREALLNYGESIVEYQWLRRLATAVGKCNVSEINDEILNCGCDEWNVKDHPDWLLLQIQCDIKIRKEQVESARQMMSPQSGYNSASQLMMGKGKSSVIIPMIAVVLADRAALVRIIVPKALLYHAGTLLSHRLGGLLGRRLFHLPWSRQTPLTCLPRYRSIHNQCLFSRGVMLTLHEHVLAFRLSGLQLLTNGDPSDGGQLLEVGEFFQRRCRDIIDECDQTLSVKTQLIYPFGAQGQIDGSPHRWKTSEAVLHLVKKTVAGVESDFRDSIQVEGKPHDAKGFPVIHFLREDAERALVKRLGDEICQDVSSVLPLGDKTTEAINIIRCCLDGEGKAAVLASIRDIFNQEEVVKKVLLLRGLLVREVLCMALGKRWNVSYGLHLTRCHLAVPYRAKGVPSLAAEFGHPDMAILTTCLSYYCAGLNSEQVRRALQKVLELDDPESEYDAWALAVPDLPRKFSAVSCINLDDDVVCEALTSYFAHCLEVIDFYMNNFVFPKEAKCFEKKHAASAWDLVLNGYCTNGDVVRTTGFSGTNDNKSLLPLSIRQEEVDSLRHTNAEVLSYLLEDRSSSYVHACRSNGGKLSAHELLDLVVKQYPPVTVILDAGAQVLELDNKTVAQEWLKRNALSDAALYFNENDRPIILYHNGKELPLYSSPFANDLTNCLVYLDESHTRGIDLKLGQ